MVAEHVEGKFSQEFKDDVINGRWLGSDAFD